MSTNSGRSDASDESYAGRALNRSSVRWLKNVPVTSSSTPL